MNTSFIYGLFRPQKAILEDPNKLKIYTEDNLQSQISIDYKPNMVVQDIIRFLYFIYFIRNPHYDEEKIKSEFDLILIVTFDDDVKLRISRRLFPFEKIPRPDRVLDHKYLLNDFQIRKHLKEQKQSVPPVFDHQFEVFGSLQKKNKKGVYINTKVYLSYLYFGFFNANKNKMKLSKLDIVQLYVWDDQVQNSFKIITQKKIYFFRTFRQDEFKYWLNEIETRLENAHYRNKMISIENTIMNTIQSLVNNVEEMVQISLNYQPQPDYISDLKTMLEDPIDQQLVDILLTKNLHSLSSVYEQISNERSISMPSNQRQIKKYVSFYSPCAEYIKKYLSAQISGEELFQIIENEMTLFYFSQYRIVKVQQDLYSRPMQNFKQKTFFQPNFNEFYTDQ